MNDPHRIEQCRTYQLCNPANWSIQGHSKAGERTGFQLNIGGKCKVFLDAGLSTYRTVGMVCNTHCHTDHCESLPYMITSRSGSSTVLMPSTAVDRICLLERAILGLSRNMDYSHQSSDEEVWAMQGIRPIAVNAGDKIQVPELKNMEIEILKAYHDAQSVGYGFTIVKNKLKEEYRELIKTIEGRQQIATLRKQGIDITEAISEPQLAFYCDSTHHNLTDHDEWKKYPVVMCECTGFPLVHTPEQMQSRYHTHLDDILPIMRLYLDKQWILIHTSMTLGTETLRDKETELRAEGLNVTIVRDIE